MLITSPILVIATNKHDVGYCLDTVNQDIFAIEYSMLGNVLKMHAHLY